MTDDQISAVQIGRTIKLVRIGRGMTQRELATAADLSVSYLSLVERGKRDMNYSTFEAICRGLAVPKAIIVFLALDRDRIKAISPELAEKLAATAMELIREAKD